MKNKKTFYSTVRLNRKTDFLHKAKFHLHVSRTSEQPQDLGSGSQTAGKNRHS